jgi:hypothetical protein
MYEVGLAHAIRQATEILLIRSDHVPLNFDIAQIHVHTYDHSDLTHTRQQLASLVPELLKQISVEKSLKVQRAIDQLDADMLYYIKQFAGSNPFLGPAPRTRGEELTAITLKAALSRLQQLGIFRTDYPGGDSPPIFFTTQFGRAVASSLGVKNLTA